MRVGLRHIITSLFACGFLLGEAVPASACDCHDGGPVCQAFWETPVVFAGRVEMVEPIAGGSDFDRIRTRFRVTEQFRGAPATEIELITSNTSCDLFFKIGEEWLIYAFPRANGVGLTTGTCSRSRLLTHADDDLAYARAVYSRESNQGRIFGRLISLQQSKIVPVPGVLISLTSADQSITYASALTGGDGGYEMLAYPGRYAVSARLPRGMTLGSHPIIDLRDGRGCVETELAISYTGEVTGRVVDHAGAPISNLTIEFIRLDGFDVASSRLRAITNNAGHFAVTDVATGRYKAAIVAGAHNSGQPEYFVLGRTTNPSHEPQFQIEGGQTRALGTLALSKSIRTSPISGIVVNTEGRPEPNTIVRVKADVDGPAYPWTTIRTDKHGRFAFALVTGIHYRLVVERWDAAASRRSAIIKIDPFAASSLRIVLH